MLKSIYAQQKIESAGKIIANTTLLTAELLAFPLNITIPPAIVTTVNTMARMNAAAPSTVRLFKSIFTSKS